MISAWEKQASGTAGRVRGGFKIKTGGRQSEGSFIRAGVVRQFVSGQGDSDRQVEGRRVCNRGLFYYGEKYKQPQSCVCRGRGGHSDTGV